MQQYLDLLKDIKENGKVKTDRTNTGTISVFGRMFRHSFENNKFPLLTTKKMAWKTMVVELLFFLKGRTDLKYMVDRGCNIWVGDAYKKYKTNNNNNLSKDEFVYKIKNDKYFSEKWGDLGVIYGSQWRNWNGIDQIKNIINDLKNNPDSRRLIVSAWRVDKLQDMILYPCHYGFQCYTTKIEPIERYYKFNEYAKLNSLDITGMSSEDAMKYYNYPTRKLSLMYNARSQDFLLGTPFNISSYGLLLLILSKQVNMIPDELISIMGDCHIYSNHLDGVEEQLNREPLELPSVKIKNKIVNDISEYDVDDFILENYKSYPSIKFSLNN